MCQLIFVYFVQETKKHFLILAVAAVLVALYPSFSRLQSRVAGSFVENFSALPVAANRVVSVPEPQDPPELNLQGAAVLVRDLHSGAVIYEKNARERLPIASLTKLMTAVVAAERLSFDGYLAVSAADLNVPEQRAGLLNGEEIRVGDLFSAMLVGSANDAAMALARAAGGTVSDFVAAMNSRATALGMADTAFTNPVGLDAPGHYSTAEDLGKLVEEFLRHPELATLAAQREAVFMDRAGRHSHRLATTNKLMLTDSHVIGLKTGYTTEARGNLILLTDEPQVFYSILLGSDNREQESARILSWVRGNFVWK